MCLALLFSGVAGAATADEKCANDINKGASKVSKALMGDMAACIKNAGKGKTEKLGSGCSTASCCLTADAKGKVAKAISKIDVSDCADAAGYLPDLVIDPVAIGDIMLAKDLELVAAIFGTDLDSVVVLSDKLVPGSKEAARCQAAVSKALGKCQDAKLSSFNACKKTLFKEIVPPPRAPTLQAWCMGTNGTGESIPDTKNKIDKKCITGISDTLNKKCPTALVDPNALFPPCAGEDLADCLDQKVECEVCKALNALDGLSRNCDEFDDGVANESCP
jgi:hypothetical protein